MTRMRRTNVDSIRGKNPQSMGNPAHSRPRSRAIPRQIPHRGARNTSCRADARMVIPKESLRAAAWGTAMTVVLAALIVAGSRNLDHFDAALVGYTFAVLFATFGVTFR